MKVKSLSRVQLSATPWTAAYQAPPSMEFSRQEYWNGVPLPSPLLPPIAPQMHNTNFISLTLSAAPAAKLLQLCPTLCNPTSCWDMEHFLGWVFQAQERQKVKQRQELSAHSAWALLQHRQGLPFFKLIPEGTDLWWTKILPPHVGPQEKPLRYSGIRVRSPIRRSVKCSQAGSWLDLVLQVSWETWSHASLKQNSEAPLFAGNAHDSSCLKPSLSSSILLSFLPMVGTPDRAIILSRRNLIHSFTLLRVCSGHQVVKPASFPPSTPCPYTVHSPMRKQDKTHVIRPEAYSKYRL